MSGFGAMEAQLQIRQNATEMQDYLKDLFEWEKGMKKADQKVQSQAADPNRAEAQAPAPRGRAASKVGAAPLDMQKPGQPIPGGVTKPKAAKQQDLAVDSKLAGTAAAHTYSSYSKWDKMKLDDSDEEDGGAASSSMQKAAPAPVPAPKPQSSVVESSSSSSAGVFGQAAASVVPAPREAPPETDLPPIRNAEPQTSEEWRVRGNTLFKVGQLESARECYSRSILVEPSCLAYANRAMVEIKLSNWEAAENDCTEALQLDPGYTKGYHRRGTARRSLGKHLEAAEDFDAALRCEPTNKAIQSERDAELSKYMAANKLQPLTKRTKLKLSVQRQSDTATAGGQADLATGRSGTTPTSRTAAASSAFVMPVPTKAIQLVSAQPRTAPKTSVDFENAWRSMAGEVQQQVAYLKLIDPATLPSIFKTSLTGPVLASFVRAVLTGMDSSAGASGGAEEEPGPLVSPQLGADLLSSLSTVPRFDMTSMCLTSKDKAELKGLWDKALEAAADNQPQFEMLRKKYRL